MIVGIQSIEKINKSKIGWNAAISGTAQKFSHPLIRFSAKSPCYKLFDNILKQIFRI